MQFQTNFAPYCDLYHRNPKSFQTFPFRERKHCYYDVKKNTLSLPFSSVLMYMDTRNVCEFTYVTKTNSKMIRFTESKSFLKKYSLTFLQRSTVWVTDYEHMMTRSQIPYSPKPCPNPK